METLERQIQAERYARIAKDYDLVHADAEHEVAFWYLTGMLNGIGATSLLDVGAGAGRVLLKLREIRPDLRVAGIEPVEALRRAGHEKGIPADMLIDGDGYQLPFPDGAFDVVTEFGILHHVRQPERVVAEMLRVARRAVFLSDSNNFGGGSAASRLIKQGLRTLGLWPAVNFLKTGGKGYSITEGDGLFYSYSVFDNLPAIKAACSSVHMMNTRPSGPNLYRTTEHLAIFAIKKN